MREQVKCVFFDLGNVLVKVLPETFEERLRSECSARCKEGEVVDFFENSKAMRLYTEGKMDSSRFFTNIKRRFRLKVKYHDFYDIFNGMFEIDHEACALIEKISSFYPEIALGVLSNTNESHYEHLKKEMPVLGKMDLEVLSYVAGHQKPQKPIYTYAVEKAGLPAKNCFFTDDKTENIKAARVCGMRAFIFRGSDECQEDLKKCGISFEGQSL